MELYIPKIIVKDSRFRRLAGLLLALGLIGAVFYSAPLVELFTMVLRRKGSSHGLLVPLLCLYFIWWKRSKLMDIESKYEIVSGLVPVAGGLLLFLLTRAHDQLIETFPVPD